MGFAAEIKEFLGAAKDSWKLMSDTEKKDAETKYTQAKTKETESEMNDPLNQQLKEAKLAHEKASTANIGKMSPLQQLQYKLMLQAQQNPPQGAAAIAQQPTNRPAIGVGAPERETDDPNLIGPPSSLANQPVLYQAKGGLVRKFAVGGMVDDEDLADDEVTPEVTPEAMPPAIGAAPPSATDFSAQRRPAVSAVPTPRPKPPELQAVADGLKYGATQMQQLPAIGGARSRAVQGYARGAGGAPPENMLEIYKKIDPKGEMGESERNLYAMQAIHQYKTNMGDPEGAARAAFQMLQTYKTAATRYAAIAAVAMKEGHVDEGMKAAMKAYAQVPDGVDMKLYRGKGGRIGWEAKDKDGKPISGGIATPEEIGSAAMNLVSPGGFEQHLVQMVSGAKIGGRTIGEAGARGKKAEEPSTGASEAMKPGDYEKLKAQTEEHVDKWVETNAASPEGKRQAKAGKELKPSEIAAMKNGVLHIRANSGMTDDEALRTFQDFVTAPATYGGKEQPPFKLIKDDENNTRTLRFPDGRTVSMPTSDYSSLAAARGQALKQAEEEANKPEKEGYGAKFGRAAEAGSKMLHTESQRPKYTGEVTERPPQRGRMGVVGAADAAIAAREPEVPPAAAPAIGAAPAIPSTYQRPEFARQEQAVPAAPYNPRLGQYGRRPEDEP